MKKTSYILLALLLCLSLAACGGKMAAVQDLPEDAAKESAEKVQTGKEDTPTFRLDSYTVADERRADDGRLLATCEYQIPQITALHADGTPYDPASEGKTQAVRAMESINQYFTDWLTGEQKWFEEMTQMAREDYEANGSDTSRWPADDTFYYSDTMGFESWQNDNLLCITMDTYGFTGGVHGYRSRSAVSFLLGTGAVLQIADATDDFSAMNTAVVNEILRQIEERKSGEEPLVYFDDYAATVQGWTERAVALDSEGFTVIFPAYDIAAYAVGEQSFHIPYDLVRPYLSAAALAMLELT